MLTIPTELANRLEAGDFDVRVMVLFDLPDGKQGIWTDVYPLTYDEVIYQPLAGNMVLASIPGSTQLESDKVDIQVTGLNLTIQGIIAEKDWHQRPATVFLAFLDEVGDVLHVMPRFSGFVDAAPISEASDDTCILTITIESNNRELARSTGRTRSDADQRLVDADDEFFKYTATATTDVAIYWGRKGPQSPVG